MPSAPSDVSRLCVHTMTTKPWSLGQCVSEYARAGIPDITVWRNVLEPMGAAKAGRLIRDSGMNVVSLCRGGFFPAIEKADRQKAIDDNKRAIEEAHAIGAPLIVLVCGAIPGMPLTESREHIRDGIAAILPDAVAASVKLAIEPLHPMYADDRSAINTMRQANDMVDALAHPSVGVAIDVYHLWWDPELESQIKRCGERGHLFAFHVCDWRTPTRHLLTDRDLMGEGCIPIRQIRQWVEETGFDGPIEVEIFSQEYWQTDQREYLNRIKQAYLNHC